MDTKPLHCRVSPDVKDLITAAAISKGKRLTGSPGKLTPWVVGILVAAALKELHYDSLEDWLDQRG